MIEYIKNNVFVMTIRKAGLVMEAQKSQFNRNLLITLAVLFALSMAGLFYFSLSPMGEGMPWWMALLNALILSIPLGLIFGSIYVLMRAWREHSQTGQVDERLRKIIHWAPRVASIAIIFFISLFSFDVFDTEASTLQLLGGFLMHNIPSIVMLVLLFFAWRRPQVGFWAFLAAGIVFIIFFVRSIYALTNLLLFVLPIWLVAGLFYADWKMNS
jgi:hypothetical protein